MIKMTKKDQNGQNDKNDQKVQNGQNDQKSLLKRETMPALKNLKKKL